MLVAIEMTEMVRFFRALTGKFPEIVKMRGEKRGFFKGLGEGIIKLNAKIFADPGQALKTLAHELGHLWDYLAEFRDDWSLARGNIIGRIHTLHKYMKNVYGEETITNKNLREELIAVSEFWRPHDKEAASSRFIAYRKSAKELYADAISVLFNSPGTLERMAPTFYKELFKNLDKKPQVKEEFFYLQSLLNGELSDLLDLRQKDLRAGYMKAEELWKQKILERETRDNRTIERLRQGLLNAMWPVVTKVRALKEKGVYVPPEQDPEYLIQEFTLADNVNYEMLGRIDTDIVQPMENAGITRQDASDYIILTRIIKERTNIANPHGFDRNTAPQQLQHLKDNLGTERFDTLENLMHKWHDIIFESVETAVKVGTYNKEVFETKLLPNKYNYAAFAVVDYLQEYMPPGIKAQVGTLKEIANAFDATMLKTTFLNRLNVLQAAKNGFMDTWLENFPEEIEKAEVLNPGDKVRIFRKKAGMGIFTRLEDGKVQGYYVDPYIAESWEKMRPGEASILVKILGGAASKNIFYPIYVAWNVGFQVWNNPLRDFTRTYHMTFEKGIKQTTMREVLLSALKNIPHAFHRALNIYDKTIETMMDEFALDVPFNDWVSNKESVYEGEDVAYNRMLERYHLIPRKKDNFIDKLHNSLLLKPVIKILQAIEFIGKVNEPLWKIAAWDMMKKRNIPTKERAYKVRNYAGTPFYREKGKWTNETNSLFMFSHIMLKGFESDMHMATNPKTRGAYWFKTSKMFMPRFLMYLAGLGVGGKLLKDFYDRVPKYYKDNYYVIPLGYQKGGDYRWKAIFMTIPHAEFQRLTYGLFINVLNAMTPGEMTKWTGVLSYGGGQFPSMNPSLKIGETWVEFFSGRNPYDRYRGRTIIPDAEWKAGGWPALKKMVQWTANQAGLANFATYDPSTKSTFETVVQMTPGINRIIRVSDYGMAEKSKNTVEQRRQQKAELRTDLPDNTRKVVSELFFLRARKDAKDLNVVEERQRLNRLNYFYQHVYLPQTKLIENLSKKGDLKGVERQRMILENRTKQFEKNRGQ